MLETCRVVHAEVPRDPACLRVSTFNVPGMERGVGGCISVRGVVDRDVRRIEPGPRPRDQSPGEQVDRDVEKLVCFVESHRCPPKFGEPQWRRGGWFAYSGFCTICCTVAAIRR